MYLDFQIWRLRRKLVRTVDKLEWIRLDNKREGYIIKREELFGVDHYS